MRNFYNIISVCNVLYSAFSMKIYEIDKLTKFHTCHVQDSAKNAKVHVLTETETWICPTGTSYCRLIQSIQKNGVCGSQAKPDSNMCVFTSKQKEHYGGSELLEGDAGQEALLQLHLHSAAVWVTVREQCHCGPAQQPISHLPRTADTPVG